MGVTTTKGWVVALAAISIAACGSGGTPSFSFTGSITSPNFTGGLGKTACSVVGISAGDSVVLKDQNGSIIGTSALLPGANPTGAGCTFFFNMDVVPKRKFYTFTVGSHPSPVYTEAELRGGGAQMILP